MAITARTGQGFLTGGVTDTTPDWLGSYNEGVEGAQQQQTTRLSQQETRQRMSENAALEARRAQEFANQQADRQADIDAASTNALGATVPFNATPGAGLMKTYQVPVAPEPRAPSDKYAGELVQPISREQFTQLLPEMARMEQANGLPPNYLETISMLESSGGANMGTGEKYIGMFQIGPEVAKDFDITPDQLRDPKVNAEVAAKLAGRNTASLRKSLGREPQPWELYLAHQQGIRGAIALLKNPNGRAIDVMTSVYRSNRAKAKAAITQNGGRLDMTAGEFAQLWAKKFGGALPQPFTGGPEAPAGTQTPVTNQFRGSFGLGAIAPAAQPSAVSPKSDLPAGVAEPTPPAAPIAPAAPGLRTQPASEEERVAAEQTIASDIMPSVTRDELIGVQTPGQGSIANQIMRSPPGQAAALPDTGMYIVEPMRITNELRQLAAQRSLLERQFAVAQKRRDFATMTDIQNKAAQLGAANNLMQGMEVIAKMQQGDDETFASALSGLTQGRARLQPRSDGAFNYYYDGQLRAEGVDRNQIIAGLRMQYDQQYQANVAARVEQQNAVQTEVLKGEIERNKLVTQEQAKMFSQIAVEQFKRANPTPNLDMQVADDGMVTVLDKNTGTVRRLVPTPILGVDGQPMLNPDGTPKLQLEDQAVKRTVPVQ